MGGGAKGSARGARRGADGTAEYQARRAHDTVLHRLVRDNLEEFLRLSQCCCCRCGGRLQKMAVVRDLGKAERLLRKHGSFHPLHPAARPRGPSPPPSTEL